MKVRIRLVGFELIKQGGIAFNIVGDCSGLADVKHLAYRCHASHDQNDHGGAYKSRAKECDRGE